MDNPCTSLYFLSFVHFDLPLRYFLAHLTSEACSIPEKKPVVYGESAYQSFVFPVSTALLITHFSASALLTVVQVDLSFIVAMPIAPQVG